MILDDDLVKASDWECQQELNAEVVIVWCCHGRHPVQRVLLEQYMYTLHYSALETFVIIALYKSTFTIYHTITHLE